MSFDGGYNSNPGYPGFQYPCGWQINGNTLPSGNLSNGFRYSSDSYWQVTLPTTSGESGYLFQSAYLDAYGAPILIGNQSYSIRFWAAGNGAATTSAPTVVFQIHTPSIGFI